MQIPEKKGMFYLGKDYDPKTAQTKETPFFYPSKDFTTHAVCAGMTGSGKTGLGIIVLEEAALQGIPAIVIDPKGDMGNILLTFPEMSAETFKPWIDQGEAERKGQTLDTYAQEAAKSWQEGLKNWGQTPERIKQLKSAVSMQIYTPGSKAGTPLSILSSFQPPSKELLLDEEALRQRVLSTTSSLLRLLGQPEDPVKSKEHILLSTLITKAWEEGKTLELSDLIQQVQKPPFDKIGALDIDTFFPQKERMALSVTLNNLLAAPGFQNWMEGAPLEIDRLLYTKDNKPKISILSIAHLNDAERMFFVTLFLNQLLTWMRKQPGTSSLRALFYMDEIAGYFPPIANPPSKAPMITLLKQARAYGLGLMLCTQNPVDLDYKGLSNCGTWFIGRLQTARDKARVIEGLTAASNGEMDTAAIDALMSRMLKRVFIMRSIYEKEPILFQTRWTLTYLRGPLTLAQIERLTPKEKNDPTLETPTATVDAPTTLTKPPLTDIPQYFALPANKIIAAKVCYQPFLAGFVKLHFVDKKKQIDEWLTDCLVAGLDQEGVKTVAWEGAESRPDLREQLSKSPLSPATYNEVPTGMLQEKQLPKLKSDLAGFLYQNNTLKLFEFKDLKLVSGAKESESAFRTRVVDALKMRYSEQRQSIHADYDKKITALSDKIRKAEEKKSAQEQQSLYQKFIAFCSFLTTLIGAFFGKKVTKTTITQAGSTLKSMGRIGKESQEVTHAEENLQVLQQRLQDLNAKMESELGKFPENIDAGALTLDEVLIRPRKTDICIDELALVWRPE